MTLKNALIQALTEVGFTEQEAVRQVITVGSCHNSMAQLNDDCIPDNEAREAIDTMKERFGYYQVHRDEALRVREDANRANGVN